MKNDRLPIILDIILALVCSLMTLALFLSVIDILRL